MTLNESSSDQALRLRVLIADDVQETRRAIRLMLSLDPDLEVVAIAHNGQEAVTWPRSASPTWPSWMSIYQKWMG